MSFLNNEYNLATIIKAYRKLLNIIIMVNINIKTFIF